MIFKRVIMLENVKLNNDYYGLKGIVRKYNAEQERKRDIHGNLQYTDKIIESVMVEFTDELPYKEMCKTLWVTIDCIKELDTRDNIIKSSTINDSTLNDSAITPVWDFTNVKTKL